MAVGNHYLFTADGNILYIFIHTAPVAVTAYAYYGFLGVKFNELVSLSPRSVAAMNNNIGVRAVFFQRGKHSIHISVRIRQ